MAAPTAQERANIAAAIRAATEELSTLLKEAYEKGLHVTVGLNGSNGGHLSTRTFGVGVESIRYYFPTTEDL